MATSRSIQVFSLTLFVLCISATSSGQDTETGSEAEKPTLFAKDLAAFEAFRRLIASRPYELSEDQLLRMVEDYLGQSKAKPPLALPVIPDLKVSLDFDFQGRYDATLRKAT